MAGGPSWAFDLRAVAFRMALVSARRLSPNAKSTTATPRVSLPTTDRRSRFISCDDDADGRDAGGFGSPAVTGPASVRLGA